MAVYPSNGSTLTVDGTPVFQQLLAADGTLTDTNSLITSWVDSGDWQQVTFTTAAAASRYLPIQGPAVMAYPVSQLDLSGIVSADGYARKLLKVRIEVDGTSSPPSDWYLYAGLWDSTTNMVGGGGRYASATWDTFVTSYSSFAGGSSGGTEPIGTAMEGTITPTGPWDGSVNGSDIAIEQAVSTRRYSINDTGNWDPTTATVRIAVGQRSALAGEVVRFRVYVCVLSTAATP